MAQDGIFALTYSMALPTGSTSDFIDKFSARGFGVEGRGFVSDNISLGGSFAWNVFFKEELNESYTEGTQTLTGNFYKYINAYPINFTAHYYFGDYDAKYRFNVGLGIGTSKINQEVEFGAYQIQYNYWHFNMAPEVGVLIPMNYRTNIIASARYNYAFKSNDTEYGWFGFNIGLAWY